MFLYVHRQIVDTIIEIIHVNYSILIFIPGNRCKNCHRDLLSVDMPRKKYNVNKYLE